MGGSSFPPVPPFVDRRQEMDRLAGSLDRARAGKGHLLLVRGDAGAGKTRLVQETVAEAEARGFAIGFGTALAESVVTYHPWSAVLQSLELAHLLDEAPPPKLLGLYAFTPEGRVTAKADREGTNAPLSEHTRALADVARGSDAPANVVIDDGPLVVLQAAPYCLVLHRGKSFHVGAILEGREDESFLADMRGLVEGGKSDESALRAFLESGKYEGIDYSKEDPKLRQSRLFELTALGLARKAAIRPVLAAIDDLQWADPSSLALLHYVARNTRASAVLLLGTYRVEEGAVRPHLRTALEGMAKEDLVAEVDLRGIPREDLAPLAESFLGRHALPDDFLNLVWQETHGNPLFVREVLRGLEGDGAIQVRGAAKRLVRSLEKLAIPERVREAIRVRLDKLPRGDRELLDAAAACGTRFTAALVARLAGEAEGTVANGLGAIAQVHGLLRRVDHGFAFDHPTVQEVVYEDTPSDAKKVYHREAAEWLELAGGPLEDIAEHYFRAGDPRAIPKLREAGDAAEKRYANAEAIRFYSEALGVEQDVDNKVSLFNALGALYRRLGDYGETLTCYEQALALAGTKEKKAEFLVRIGTILNKRGEIDESLRVCLQALNLVTGDAGAQEALALQTLGVIHYYRGDHDQAVDYWHKALEIRERIGDQSGIAASLECLGIVHNDRGQYDQALDRYRQSLLILEKIGDQGAVANTLYNLGIMHNDRGDDEQALDCCRRSLAIWGMIGDIRGVALALHHLGIVHNDRGDDEQALDCCRRSLAIWGKIGDPWGIAITLNNLGIVYRDRGDYEAALDCHQRSLELRQKIGDKPGIAESLYNLGRVHEDRGDRKLALDHLERSLELAEGSGYRRAQLEAQLWHAEIRCRMGNLKKARDVCNLVSSYSTQAGFKWLIAESQRILGMVSREQNAWSESIGNLEESIRISKQIGRPLAEGKSRFEFGLLWKLKGEKGKATEQLSAAAGIFQKIKAVKELERAKSALKDLGG